MKMSDCCGAVIDGIDGGEETGICPDCHEHCTFVSGEEDEKLPQCAGCMFEERGGSNCWHCTRNPIVKDNYWPNASVTGAAKPRTVDAVLAPEWFPLSDGHALLWDPGADDEWPLSLWLDDKKLAAYRTADALIDDVEYREDITLADGEFGRIQDWANKGADRP